MGELREHAGELGTSLARVTVQVVQAVQVVQVLAVSFVVQVFAVSLAAVSRAVENYQHLS